MTNPLCPKTERERDRDEALALADSLASELAEAREERKHFRQEANAAIGRAEAAESALAEARKDEREMCTTHPDRPAISFAAYCAECRQQVKREESEASTLRAALQGAREDLLGYLRGESGLPFTDPYKAARTAVERIDRALTDQSDTDSKGDTE